MPAVKPPNDAAGPSVSDSVAGTLPPTVPVGGAVSAKSVWLTSKNTLPTASTFTRAFGATTLGMMTSAEPSFAVEPVSTYGHVAPLSVDSEILTLATLTGGTSVPATSHVMRAGAVA